MTIDQYIVSNIGDRVTNARVLRTMATAFVRSAGIVSVGDCTITGDPTSLAVNVSAGMMLLPMPGARQGFEPFIVDAPEKRTLATATAARVDLLYAGVQSKEFGDPINFKELYAQTGVPGQNAPGPLPMAAALPMAYVTVPKGATLGTQCTITPLLRTAAPVRDGGYAGGDVDFPDQPQQYYHRTGIGSNGTIIAHNGYPKVPRYVTCEGTYPRSGPYRPTTFVPNFGSELDVGRFSGTWYGPDGNPLSVDPGLGYFEFVATMWPGSTLVISPP